MPPELRKLVLSSCKEYLTDCFVTVCAEVKDSYINLHSVALSAINILFTIMDSCGAASTFSTNREYSLEITVKQLTLFACVWTFGVYSPVARASVEDWFSGIWEKPPDNVDSAQDLLVAQVFPHSSKCFDYLLQPDGFDRSVFYWVPWQTTKIYQDVMDPLDAASGIKALKMQGVDQSVNNKSSRPIANAFKYAPAPELYLYEPEGCRILAPTASSKSLVFIMGYFMSASPASEYHLVVLGQSCSSKSSTLRLIADSMLKFHHVYGVMANERNMTVGNEIDSSDSSIAHKLERFLSDAETCSKTRFAETGVKKPRSILFIDDVNLQPLPQKDHFASASSIEFLRSIYQQGAVFRESAPSMIQLVQKRISQPTIFNCSKLATVIAATLPATILCSPDDAPTPDFVRTQRILNNTHVVCLEDNCTHCFAPLLSAIIPNLNGKLALDLVSITTKLSQAMISSSPSMKAISVFTNISRPWVWTAHQILNQMAASVINEKKGTSYESTEAEDVDMTAMGQELPMQHILRNWEIAVHDSFAEFMDDKGMIKCLNHLFNETSFFSSGFTDMIHGTRRKAQSLRVDDLKNLNNALNPPSEEDAEGKPDANQKLAVFYKPTFGTADEKNLCGISSASVLQRVVSLSPSLTDAMKSSGIASVVDISTPGFWFDFRKILSIFLPIVPPQRCPFYLLDSNIPKTIFNHILTAACNIASCGDEKFKWKHYCVDDDTIHLNILTEAVFDAYQNNYAGTDSGVTVWHIHVDTISCLSPTIWTQITSIFDMTSYSIYQKFMTSRGQNISSLKYTDTGQRVESFLSRQRYIVSVGDGFSPIERKRSEVKREKAPPSPIHRTSTISAAAVQSRATNASLASVDPVGALSSERGKLRLGSRENTSGYCFDDVCTQFFLSVLGTPFLNRCLPLQLFSSNVGIIDYIPRGILKPVRIALSGTVPLQNKGDSNMYASWYGDEITRLLRNLYRPVVFAYYPSYNHVLSAEYTAKTCDIIGVVYAVPSRGDVVDVSVEWMNALLWSHSKLKNIYYRNNKRQHAMDSDFRKLTEDYLVSNNIFGLNEFRHRTDYERVRNEAQQNEYTVQLIRISLSSFVFRMRYFLCFDWPELFEGVVKRSSHLFTSTEEHSEEKLIDAVYICSAYCKLLQRFQVNINKVSYEQVIKIIQVATILPRKSKLRGFLLCICLSLLLENVVYIVDPSHIIVPAIAKIFGLSYELTYNHSIVGGHDLHRLTTVKPLEHQGPETAGSIDCKKQATQSPCSTSTILHLTSCIATRQEDNTACANMLPETLLLHCVMSPWLLQRRRNAKTSASKNDSMGRERSDAEVSTAANERDALNALMTFCIAEKANHWTETADYIRKPCFMLFNLISALHKTVSPESNGDVITLAERLIFISVPRILQKEEVETGKGMFDSRPTSARADSGYDISNKILSELSSDLFDELISAVAEDIALSTMTEAEETINWDAEEQESLVKAVDEIDGTTDAEQIALGKAPPDAMASAVTAEDYLNAIWNMISCLSDMMAHRMVHEERNRVNIMMVTHLSCSYITDTACQKNFTSLFLFMDMLTTIQRDFFLTEIREDVNPRAAILNSAAMKSVVLRKKIIADPSECFMLVRRTEDDNVDEVSCKHEVDEKNNFTIQNEFTAKHGSMIFNPTNKLYTGSTTVMETMTEEDLLYDEIRLEDEFEIYFGESPSESDLLELFLMINETKRAENNILCSHALWNLLVGVHCAERYGILIFSSPVSNEAAREKVVEKLQDLLYSCLRLSSYESILPNQFHYDMTLWSSLGQSLSPIGVFIVALIVDPTAATHVMNETLRRNLLLSNESRAVAATPSPKSSAVALQRGEDGSKDMSKVYLNENALKICKSRCVNVFSGIFVDDYRIKRGQQSTVSFSLAKAEYASNKDPTADVLAKPTAHFLINGQLTPFEISWLLTQLSGSRRNCIIELTRFPQMCLPEMKIHVESIAASAGAKKAGNYSFLHNRNPSEIAKLEQRMNNLNKMIDVSTLDVYSDVSISQVLSRSISAVMSDGDITLTVAGLKSSGDEMKTKSMCQLRSFLNHRISWLMVITHTLIISQLRRVLSKDAWIQLHIGDDTLQAALKYLLSINGAFVTSNRRAENSTIHAEYIAATFYRTREQPSQASWHSEAVLKTILGEANNLDEACIVTVLGNELMVPDMFSKDSAQQFLLEVSNLEAIAQRRLLVLPGLRKDGDVEKTDQKKKKSMIMDIAGMLVCNKLDLSVSSSEKCSILFNRLIESVSVQRSIAARVNLKAAKRTLEVLNSKLPPKIDMKCKEIVESGFMHRLIQVDGNLAAVLPALRRNKFNLNRRRHQRQRKQSSLGASKGEFDSLWSYALLEAQHLNETLDRISGTLASLLTTLDLMIDIEMDSVIPLSEQTNHFLYNQFSTSFLENIAALSEELVPQEMCAIAEPVNILDWSDGLKARHNMLLCWLMNGSPGLINVHLLTNPSGLLHALRETCLDRHQDIESKIHQIHVESEIIDTSHFEDSDVVELTRNDPDGTTVVIAGLQLCNATWMYDEYISLPDEYDFIDRNNWRHKQDIAIKLSVTYSDDLDSADKLNIIKFPIEDIPGARSSDSKKELCPLYVYPHESVILNKEPVKIADKNTVHRQPFILMYVPVLCFVKEKRLIKASEQGKFQVAKTRFTNVSLLHNGRSCDDTVAIPIYVSIVSRMSR